MLRKLEGFDDSDTVSGTNACIDSGTPEVVPMVLDVQGIQDGGKEVGTMQQKDVQSFEGQVQGR